MSTSKPRTILKLISPYLILVVSLSLVLSILDALSMLVFSDAISQTFSGSSAGVDIGVSVIDIGGLSIKEKFALYIFLFIFIVVLNWLVTYFSNRIGVVLFKRIHASIMTSELKSFQEDSISHYQVLLFEEVRNVQERFFVALSVVIHRSIFVILSVTMLINAANIDLLIDTLTYSSSILIIPLLLIFVFSIYRTTKIIGELSLRENKGRYQSVTHGFWQWRWIRIRGQESELISFAQKSGNIIAKFLSTVTTIGLSFKNILEIIIFIIILLNYELLTLSDSIYSGTLIFGGVLLFRIMPAISGILNNLVGVSSSISSFRFVVDALNKIGDGVDDKISDKTETEIQASNTDCSFKVDNIYYKVGKKSLFKNYSLCLPRKGIVVIGGESGSGKSTLLNILLGFIEPDKGYVFFNGCRISHSNRDSMWSNIGLVEQDYNNIFGTVADVMSEVRISNEEFESTLKRVFNLKDDLDIADFMKQTIRSLSGGERQRIAFLRVYFLSPPVLVLDEYGSGLDEKTLSIFRELCAEYARNHLVIWVSHINSVKEIADKLILLKER